MKISKYPDQKEWNKLAQRPAVKQVEMTTLVRSIFEDIRSSGDSALNRYSLRFDKAVVKEVPMNASVQGQLSKIVSRELREAIHLAKRNIEKFHALQRERKQVIETTPGVKCWRENRAIDTVGIYIPGGSAPLFSTVLMLAIPAKLAGCKEIVLCTPPGKDGLVDPVIRYVAGIAGVTKIFAVGGIQAIAALTFGTASIPGVDKIFGPGNQYVTAAKQMAQQYGMAIDLPAGPSEVLIIADASCRPEFVAADLLSQAEHGPDSQVILLSDSEQVIKEVMYEIKRQLDKLERKATAKLALNNSRAILLATIEECLAFSNAYAPEHLILAVKQAKKYCRSVANAGSVFLGNYSCESAGDYASGTNHTLPTNGYARSYSGVSLDSFLKKITFQELTKQGIGNIGPAIEQMAAAEQLGAHKNAVTLRLQSIKNKR